MRILFDVAERLHINFYEDDLESDHIAARLTDVKRLLQTLATLRQRPPRPPAITTREQRNRWRRLTGELLPLETGAAE